MSWLWKSAHEVKEVFIILSSVIFSSPCFCFFNKSSRVLRGLIPSLRICILLFSADCVIKWAIQRNYYYSSIQAKLSFLALLF
jgi:hypothetical protein